MTRARLTDASPRSNRETVRDPQAPETVIDHILRRLFHLGLPAKEHFENYLRHKWRLNHKPKTLFSSFTSVMLFPSFYGMSGKRDIKEISTVLASKPSSSMGRTGACISPQ
jgi:hypothetical protein